MSKLKVWVPPSWANELRKSPEVKAICRKEAEGIAERAGDGFEVEEKANPTRAKFVVKAATPEAYYKNLKENTLLKAMG